MTEPRSPEEPRRPEEIEELLGAYALDAVDPEERVLVEEHLASCPRCRAELADHLAVAALLGNTGAPAPAGVWSRIVDSLEEPPPALRLSVAPLDSTTPRSPRDEGASPGDRAPGVPLTGGRWRPRRVLWLAVAAAAALIVGLGAVVVHQDRRLDRMQREVAAGRGLESVVVDAMADPANHTMTLTSPSGEDMSATAVMTTEGTGYLMTTSMPALPDDRTYQLWGQNGDQVISLGVLGPQPHLAAFPISEELTGLAITEEVQGGVPSSSNPALLVAQGLIAVARPSAPSASGQIWRSVPRQIWPSPPSTRSVWPVT